MLLFPFFLQKVKSVKESIEEKAAIVCAYACIRGGIHTNPKC